MAIRSHLRRLDRLPPVPAGVLGLLVGVAAAVILLSTLPDVLGGAAFVVVLGLAGWLAWSGEPVAVTLIEEKERKLSVEVVAIPEGRFRMGSPEDEEGRYDEEGPVHEVTMSAFECMKTPVTRQLYAEVMGEDPGSPGGSADDRPVNNVSWFDAVRFCNRLSEHDGLEPCYAIDEKDVRWRHEAAGYRLPTEAEWEYACRAGTATRWWFGDDESQLDEHAWYSANAENEPRPVGSKKPNPWGLHDMYGNVLEWCWDWFGSYSEKPETDPTGPLTGDDRVLRGGAFGVGPRGLRSADRDWGGPEFSDRFIGFRCVLAPRRQP